jgi:hypothetical protein
MPLTEKEAAALERLEAEKNRRIEDKIQSGAAVRVPLPIVAGAPEFADADKARKLKLEQLRRNGEAREVFFDEVRIITGVPRAGRDDGYVPPNVSEPPAPSIMSRRTASAVAPRDEKTPATHDATSDKRAEIWRYVRATVERPSQTNPGGTIVEGQYAVINGTVEVMVKVTDLEGRLLGTQPVRPGDDVEAAARKVLREKRAASGFYDRIDYDRRRMN